MQTRSLRNLVTHIKNTNKQTKQKPYWILRLFFKVTFSPAYTADLLKLITDLWTALVPGLTVATIPP